MVRTPEVHVILGIFHTASSGRSLPIVEKPHKQLAEAVSKRVFRQSIYSLHPAVRVAISRISRVAAALFEDRGKQWQATADDTSLQ
jgi:hypothetical protein